MRFAFIHNPKAGNIKRNLIPRLKQEITHQLSASWHNWEPQNALHRILEEASTQADVIVSVGGDGTNRAIAHWLLTNKHTLPLALVPTGSGNGLARHLQIKDPMKSVLQLQNGKPSQIDVLKINGKYALNTAGIGLSGAVSGRFGSNRKRGLNGYLKQVVSLYRGFHTFSIRDVHGPFEREDVLSLEIGNGCQWGNGFCFAPGAVLDDGKADLACIHKVPVWDIPGQLMKMRQFQSVFENWQCTKLQLKSNTPQPWHLDGEYQSDEENWDFEILPKSLTIFV